MHPEPVPADASTKSFTTRRTRGLSLAVQRCVGPISTAMNNFIIGTKLHRLGLCLAESANHWPQFWGLLLLLRTYRLG